MSLAVLFLAAIVSGVDPRLHTFNQEGECGTGAVVPWAGRLWAVSYAPHAPAGSTDKLYEVRPDGTRVIRAESVGGTHANRFVHRETNQLFIGPYVIDAQGGVRVIPPFNPDGSTNLYGRITATARHLTDGAHKVYMLTMEEGVYEVDVDTLKVVEIFRDGNIQGNGRLDGDLLPGYHGKGAYTAQGRLVYANNGEHTPEAMVDPTVTSGVLAEWDGRREAAGWKVVLRTQFTDVTSRGGIYGAADEARDPLWTVGWDDKSVILMVLDGGVWHKYRLPKGSHSYDGAHGWNTEWPRIREIGEGDDCLMTMHGTFWHFHASMSAKNSAGIRPRSNYLKVIGDFCRWGDKIVFGCDDTAKNEFLNKRRAKGGLAGPGQSNSNLWFVDPKDIDSFGPVIGRGAVWRREDVKAGEASDPYLCDGYDHRMLFVKADGDGSFGLEADRRGTGEWEEILPSGVSVNGGRAVCIGLDPTNACTWVRLRAKTDLGNVTAEFQFWNDDNRAAVPRGGTPGGIFTGFVSDIAASPAPSKGVVRSGKGDEKLPLEMVQDDQLYVMLPGKGGKLELKKSDDEKTRDDVKKWFSMDGGKDLGDSYDAASAIMVDDDGKRWRFPYATVANVPGGEPKGLALQDALTSRLVASRTHRRTGRLCRECCTERDLLNIGGTFYELPAENAGGFAKARAVATHRSQVYDYCTWRGLLVISGVDPSAEAGEHFVKSDDGKAALWVGVADDLWKIGKPVGVGGPWLATEVKAGVPSDPYVMTGFDRKSAVLSADRDVKVDLEFDITGEGDWAALLSAELKAGEVRTFDLDGVRAYWVRAVASADCTASAVFAYR
ncbi:MAG: hypothetical protein IJ829_00460 [Kiritimatiellae bacterium]|nr:hypothetical protein [Kiritimatiellia bacterium]